MVTHKDTAEGLASEAANFQCVGLRELPEMGDPARIALADDRDQDRNGDDAGLGPRQGACVSSHQRAGDQNSRVQSAMAHLVPAAWIKEACEMGQHHVLEGITFDGFKPCDHDGRFVFGRTTYYYASGEAFIYLSPELQDTSDFTLRVVLWHEMAHAWAWRKNRITGHGKTWRSVLFAHPLLALATLVKAELLPCLIARMRQ